MLTPLTAVACGWIFKRTKLGMYNDRDAWQRLLAHRAFLPGEQAVSPDRYALRTIRTHQDSQQKTQLSVLPLLYVTHGMSYARKSMIPPPFAT